MTTARVAVATVLLALSQAACQHLTLRANDPAALTAVKVVVRSAQFVLTLGMAGAMYGATDCLTGNLRWWGKDKVRKWNGVHVRRVTHLLGRPTKVLDLPSGERSFYWSLPAVYAQRNFPYWTASRGSPGIRRVPVVGPANKLTPEVTLTVDNEGRISGWSGNCVLIRGNAT